MKNEFKVCGIGDSLIKAKSDDLYGWSYHISKKISKSHKLELNYHNFGEGGATTEEVLNRIFKEHLFRKENWDLVILGVGINDSRKRGTPPNNYQIPEEDFIKNYRHLLEFLCNNKCISRVFVAGIIPVVEELTTPFKEDKYYFFNDSIKYLRIQTSLISEFPKSIFIDFYSVLKKMQKSELLKYIPDGLHPNAEGHRFLSNVAYDKTKGFI